MEVIQHSYPTMGTRGNPSQALAKRTRPPELAHSQRERRWHLCERPQTKTIPSSDPAQTGARATTYEPVAGGGEPVAEASAHGRMLPGGGAECKLEAAPGERCQPLGVAGQSGHTAWMSHAWMSHAAARSAAGSATESGHGSERGFGFGFDRKAWLSRDSCDDGRNTVQNDLGQGLWTIAEVQLPEAGVMVSNTVRNGVEWLRAIAKSADASRSRSTRSARTYRRPCCSKSQTARPWQTPFRCPARPELTERRGSNAACGRSVYGPAGT